MMDLTEIAYESLNDLCKLISYIVEKECIGRSSRCGKLLSSLELLDSRAKGMLQLVANWGPLDAFVFHFSKTAGAKEFKNSLADRLGRFVKCRRVEHVCVDQLVEMGDTDLSYALYSLLLLMFFHRLNEFEDENIINQMDKIIRTYIKGEKPLGERELLSVLEFLARTIELKVLPIVNEKNRDRQIEAVLTLCR